MGTSVHQELLTDEHVAFYRQHGYLSVREVIPSTLLARARAVTDEFIERSRELYESDNVFDLEPAHTADEPRVRRVKNPVENDPVFDEIMRSPAVLDRVAQLIGPDIRYHASKLNTKTSAGGSPVEWHQDLAFYPYTNEDLCAVGVALDDCDEANGCLLVVPGSHLEPVIDHHVNGVMVGAVPPDTVEENRVEPVIVPAGGISIHHAKTLHASAPNRSNRPRRLLLLQYGAADAYPLGLNTAYTDVTLERFEQMIVRGRSSGIARVTEQTIRIPNYSARSGSIFEMQEQAMSSFARDQR